MPERQADAKSPVVSTEGVLPPDVVAELDFQPQVVVEPVVGAEAEIEKVLGGRAERQRVAEGGERVEFLLVLQKMIIAVEGKQAEDAVGKSPPRAQRAQFGSRADAASEDALESAAHLISARSVTRGRHAAGCEESIPMGLLPVGLTADQE